MKLVKPYISIEEALKNPEQWIPDGIYCYKPNYDSDSIFDMTGYLCPFWDMKNNTEGYCHYLEIGDWDEEGTFLLWDMCKECCVNCNYID